MATSFKKTPALNPLVKFGEKSTADVLYWKNLDVPVTKKEYGAIRHIDFCPLSPFNYAVTNSTRVQIYSARSNQILKTLSRFQEVAYSGTFRSDGSLLVAGGDEPLVRLFEPNTRALLRLFKGHSGPVHVTRFLSDNQRIMSASDDKTIRLWDIPTEKEISVFGEHQDYIRCGAVCKTSPDIFLTGSYDHSAKLYDARCAGSVLSVEHGHPVESVLLFPNANIFLTAGGNLVKVWDALAGGRLLTTLCHHHKTVTSLCFGSKNRRFLSASLDRHVQIYDVGTFQMLHSMDYPGSILSIGVAPDDSVLAVGMADGLLSIQHRNKDSKIKETKKKASFHYRLKGKTFTAQKEDLIITHKRREKMARYDKFLKRFEHSKALDAALEVHTRSQHPEVTMGVFQELIRRGVLNSSLAGRDTVHIQSILRFIQKNLSRPNFIQTLLDVLQVLLDLYENEIDGNSALESLVSQIKVSVDHEAAYMQDLLRIQGMLHMLFSASDMATSSDLGVEAGLLGVRSPAMGTDLTLNPSAAVVQTQS